MWSDSAAGVREAESVVWESMVASPLPGLRSGQSEGPSWSRTEAAIQTILFLLIDRESGCHAGRDGQGRHLPTVRGRSRSTARACDRCGS